MCLIAIAIEAHPRYPLIIAANRDEFYHRQTKSLGFWPDYPNVLAGRDLEQNGTWLGITTTGRLAAITNFREPASMNSGAPSRGLLVSNYLISDTHPEEYLAALRTSGKAYNGFNLVAGNINELWWYSNKHHDIIRIAPGIHAISNHLLDTPWPKTRSIMAGLGRICEQNKDIDREDIFLLLADTSHPPDHQLPDTGVGLEWERMLSAVFVSGDIYGTRSSAVILADHNGRITFTERTFKSGAGPPIALGTTVFEIQLPEK